MTKINAYKEIGICDKVFEFGEEILKNLEQRFKEIDNTAEYNQLKVIGAMQKNRVDAACFNPSTGY